MEIKKAVNGKKMDILQIKGEKPLFLSLAEDLISDLNQRTQEIIKKRFGLEAPKGETLEEIGKEYGITRERVRQIISEGIKNISNKSEKRSFFEAQEKIVFTIKRNNGIMREEDVVEKFNLDGQEEANAIKFFSDCSKLISEIEEKGALEKSWILNKDLIREVKEVIAIAQEIIQKEKILFTDKEIFEKLKSSFPDFSQEKILSFLKVSSKIKKNRFKKWGMAGWALVQPKVARDRIYLVLKEHGKPLHFTGIAKLIDKFELSKKKAHPQTIHNELIKDKRFVLVGRGIYALKEWGYSKGTTREVIERILSNNNYPMTREEVIREVLKVREIKEATIAINLNNPNFFKKEKGRYSVKK